MSNELILPSNVGTLTTTEQQFGKLAEGSNYLKQIDLVSKGKLVDKRKALGGDFVIIMGKDEVQVLGESIDVIVLARRAKAMKFGGDKPISNYVFESETFQQIKKDSFAKDSQCIFGTSFLVIERTTGGLYEIYFHRKSHRPEANNVAPYVYKAGEPYKAITLKSKYTEQGDFSWFKPIVLPCSTPFNSFPDQETLAAEYEKFMTPKSDELVKVDPNAAPARAR